jgi:PIN domain nuclease of toxin-antitoxin system
VIVLDTHAWLWWATGDHRLSPTVREAVVDQRVGVSAMSCFEVARLSARGRISLDRHVGLWMRQALAHEQVEPLLLDPEAATSAALLDTSAFPGGPADRIIYATALSAGAVLATKDRRLRAFDPARTLW